MGFLCFLGRHKPSVSSLSRGKHGGYEALCDRCGSLIQRRERGRWRLRDPLYLRAGQQSSPIEGHATGAPDDPAN